MKEHVDEKTGEVVMIEYESEDEMPEELKESLMNDAPVVEVDGEGNVISCESKDHEFYDFASTTVEWSPLGVSAFVVVLVFIGLGVALYTILF